MHRVFARVAVVVLMGFAACGGDDAVSGDAGFAARVPMTLAEAKDPKTCKTCHKNHYREWASSMHAYASLDPVFVAMNKRGQRETNGELGDFCLKCHAPMAVMDGKIQNAADSLTDLPPAYQGVTCYTCHNTESVEGDHNALLHLANDVTMRGPIKDAKHPRVHGVAYSPYLDDAKQQSNQMCGGCHDIVTPNGVHIERTFEEYKTSVYTAGHLGAQSCAGCHMDLRDNEVAADDAASGVGTRPVHTHLWPGVDVALTDDFPDQQVQRLAIECMLARGAITQPFDPNMAEQRASPGAFTPSIETQAGHRQPSGASQDRRMWFELLAYDSTGAQLKESSGVIADGELEDKPKDDPNYDSRLWLFRDRMFDKAGQPTHDFWNAAPSDAYPEGYETPSRTLPAQTNPDPSVPHGAQQTFRTFPGDQPGRTARVVGHLRIRPIGMDVLQDLVASGDLDASVLAKVPPPFTMPNTEFEWKLADGNARILPHTDSLSCPNSYLCLLQPDSVYCNGLDDAP
jgi:hypothetical protein